MVKSLTTNQEDARAAGGHSVSRFLSIEQPSLGVTYYSERDPDNTFSPDSSLSFIPLLSGFSLRDRSANLGLEELPKVQRFSFSIRIDDTDETSIDIQVDDSPGGFVGRKVVAYKVLRPLQGAAAPAQADWIEVFRGEIELVTEITVAHVSFTCVDFMKHKGEEKANRKISRKLFPSCPDRNLGDVMPIIFGPLTSVPGVQVSEGNFSTLDEGIKAANETNIRVADITQFTSSGKVQIGNEKLSYSSTAVISGTSGDLVVSARGIDNTTAAEHSFGQKVTQLETIRFLIADLDLTHDGTVQFNTAGAIRDGNGAILEKDKDYSIAVESIDGQNATFVDVESDGFPDINETLQNTRNVDLENFDDPIEFGTGASNNATNPANAADSKNENAATFAADAHTTAATVVTSSGTTGILHVKQTNDLSGQTGAIKKAVAFCEYAVVPAQKESFPTGSSAPEFQAVRGNAVNGTTRFKAVDLAEPGAQDAATDLFPDGARDGDSTDLFETIGDELGSQQTVETRFKGFLQTPLTQVWGTAFPTGTIEIDSFILLQNFNDGDTIDYTSTNVRSLILSGLVGATFVISGDNWVRLARLALRLFDDGSWPTDTSEILVEISLTGFTQFDADPTGSFEIIKGSGRFRIFVGTQNFTGPWVNVTGLGSNIFKTAKIRLAASTVFPGTTTNFSQADLASIEIQLDSINQVGGTRPWQLENAEALMLYKVLGVTVAIQQDIGLVGQNTALDSNSIVTSQRVTQEMDISDELIALDLLDWDFFDGSGADPPGLAIVFPASESTFQILVYRFGYRIEILDTTTRATLPSEYTLQVDCIGYKGNEDGTQAQSTLSSIIAIQTILGTVDDRFYDLNGARIDSTSLQTALDGAANDLPSESRNDWHLARRLTQSLTNRQLLGQVLTDSAIRAVIEGGKIKFFHQISPDTSPFVRTIDDNKTSSPVRRPTNIALVSNVITIQLQESLLSRGRFEDEIKVEDTTSIDEVKRRIVEYRSHFIRSSTVAQAWADIALDDFSFARSLADFNLSGGKAYDLEVGDAVALTDTHTRFSGVVGRIVSISPAADDESEVALRLALTNKRVVLWQWRNEGDSDFSKIEVNQWTQNLYFTVDNILVARLNGEALQIRGNLTVDPIAASVTNDVNSPDFTEVALDRSPGGTTGIIEYIPVPVGFSNGFIGIGVYDGATEEYYRVATLGYNTAAGSQQFDSLAVNDYEDNAAMPAILSGFTWTDHIDTTSTAADEDGNFIVSGDLRRLYLAFNKYLDGGAINGRMVVKEIQTGVDL